MDVTLEEIFVETRDSVAATRRSPRDVKPTAKAQKNMQVAANKAETPKYAAVEQMEAGDNNRGNAVGGSQVMESAGSGNESLIQTMLRTMLRETSSHLMSEQKQMLERLWDALLENQQKAAKVMSEQLEMIRHPQQEIHTVRAEAAKDRKKIEEFRHRCENRKRKIRNNCASRQLSR
ncbi:hypothetical protein FALCPG4_015789 [Fusarium falciforme]